MDESSLVGLKKQFTSYYGFKDVVFEVLNTAVNDIVVATTPSGKFALKLYHPARTSDDIQWEVDLAIHLIKNGVPIVEPISGKNGYVESFSINGKERVGLLSKWAAGEKPKPNIETYILLGKAAAQIHKAADTFNSTIKREKYDAYTLIDEQLQRMKNHFREANRWEQLSKLAERLKKLIADPSLDIGVCHMDLTLDNIYIHDDTITIFDLDSAAECFRANEPHGVLKFSRKYFEAWLDGYRLVRPFSKADETAVSAFVIIGDLRNVAWKLGVASSSRGKPLLTSVDLPKVIDEWLNWENQYL